jgi:hypothetical protein
MYAPKPSPSQTRATRLSSVLRRARLSSPVRRRLLPPEPSSSPPS